MIKGRRQGRGLILWWNKGISLFKQDFQNKGEARIFDLVCPDFSQCCGYMQYLLGDGVLYISLMILY